jgi:streptogramin lyase
MVAVVAAAAELPAAEADLSPAGGVSEVNRGWDGNLYVSEEGAGKVWVIQPSGVYTAYSVASSPLDARPDSAGDIWWADGATVFGRINVDEGTETTWDLAGDYNLWGLAIDAGDRVWMVGWITSVELYSFDPQATELCTYTLPGGTYSTYVVQQGGKLWLGNRFLDRITRFDPLDTQVTWWTIPNTVAWPLGLAVDGQGHVWWADLGLDTVARLDPDSGLMTRYDLPAAAGTDPQMVAVQGSRVWVTGGSDGTVGALDPQAAQGQTSALASGSAAWSRACTTLGAGTTTALAAPDTGSLAWTSGSLAPTYESGGWTVYQLPSGAEPYGLTAAADYLWVTDPGRDSLHRLEPAVYRVFLPVVLRK